MDDNVFYLLLAAILFIFLGRSFSKGKHVKAKKNSVAIGGDNSGDIKIDKSNDSNLLTYLGFFLEFVGVVAAVITVVLALK
jgi:hypothetical protein